MTNRPSQAAKAPETEDTTQEAFIASWLSSNSAKTETEDRTQSVDILYDQQA